MFSKPLAFALLAAGCMTAAAGGAYMALRPSPSTDALAFQQPSPTALSDASVPVATDGAPSAAPLVYDPAERPVVVETRRVTPVPVRPKRDAPRRNDATRSQRPERPVAAPAEPLDAEPPPIAGEPIEPVAAPSSNAEPSSQLARYDEVVVPSETVIGVQVDTAVSSERARVEDRVEGHVTRAVAVSERVAIPAGTKLLGSVTLVERGGKFKERARVAVRFHTAQMPDGSRLALQTTAIMREGDSPSRETAAKVGGSAVGGAIVGAILGGAKGAVLGGTAGAAGGTAIVAAGDRNPATLAAGTTVTVRLMSDVTVNVER